MAERMRFVLRWQNGQSARVIAEESGTSVATVCRWLRRWKNEGNINTKNKSGRPRQRMKKGKTLLQKQPNIHYITAGYPKNIANFDTQPMSFKSDIQSNISRYIFPCHKTSSVTTCSNTSTTSRYQENVNAFSFQRQFPNFSEACLCKYVSPPCL